MYDNNHVQHELKSKKEQVEQQAGFRRGYITIDNILTCFVIIPKYLLNKWIYMCVFVAFTDFERAFDWQKHATCVLLENKVND